MSTNSGHVTLMIISESGRSPVSIKFSRTTFRIILGAAGLLLLAVVVCLATYSTLLTQSMQRAQLAAEVQKLQGYAGKVDKLEKNLADYRVMLKKMTELAGIDMDAAGLSFADSLQPGGRTVATPQNVSEATDAMAHPRPNGYPVKGYVSRSFRPDDENPHVRHFGVDLAVSVGTPVIATADGEVTFAGWDSTFGWKVVLEHTDGLETIYGHNDSLLVQVGDMMKFGQTIAISGNTGISTAPHVHYEIRRYGVAVDPEDYLDKQK
jgi:murein DD-endopeptidase MepM/ murein hydrolase activator NlpD